MGSNALIGGIFGAGAGAGVAMIGAGAGSVKRQFNEIRKKAMDVIDDPDLKMDIAKKISNDEAVEEYFKKKNASQDELADKLDLEKAAERMGVPLTSGMKEGGTFAELEGSLAKSKSIFGDMTRKEVEKTYSSLGVL
jgi:predicted ribosome quality control (RQC) complex YloA/Tae2 family protein